jgi:hypothetical protein
MNALGEYLDQGGRVLLIGAFLGEPEGRETGLLLDIRVAQADHPLAEGFDPGQAIVLERFLAEEDYAPYVMTDLDPESVIWTRGPDSEFADEGVIAAMEDDLVDNRVVVAGVPLYLLPFEDAELLGTNIVLWLLGE